VYQRLIPELGLDWIWPHFWPVHPPWIWWIRLLLACWVIVDFEQAIPALEQVQFPLIWRPGHRGLEDDFPLKMVYASDDNPSQDPHVTYGHSSDYSQGPLCFPCWPWVKRPFQVM
jgi:hypothetical protein